MISTVTASIVLFLLGYGLGLMQRGININIVHKQNAETEKPKKYNESLAGLLPAEVQEYYHKTKGQNQF